MREQQRAWMWLDGGGEKDLRRFGGGEKCNQNTVYEKTFSKKAFIYNFLLKIQIISLK